MHERDIEANLKSTTGVTRKGEGEGKRDQEKEEGVGSERESSKKG